MKKLLFISGSVREGSLNTKLTKYALSLVDQSQAQAEFVDLAQYELPLYSQDLEAKSGIPKPAKALKEKFLAADGIFLATPEYNSSFSPLIKNVIDWLSRSTTKDEPMLAAFNDKAAAICAASPGHLGGIRALAPLRLLLSGINMNVVGNQLALSNAAEAFDSDGVLKNEAMRNILSKMVESLVRIS